MPSVSELRAEYDAKWEIYADALDKATSEAHKSVEHLRLESREAYHNLAAATRREGIYG